MPIGRHERFEWYLKVGGWTGRGTVPHPVNQKARNEAAVRGTGSPPWRGVPNDSRVITLRRSLDLALWRKKRRASETREGVPCENESVLS
ncbi:hypothetical protein K0M31_013197, partial [Melipona bicolor]